MSVPEQPWNTVGEGWVMKRSASGLARVGVPKLIAPPAISTPPSLTSPQLANNMDHGIRPKTNFLQECLIVASCALVTQD
jgi:hypothetical protein